MISEGKQMGQLEWVIAGGPVIINHAYSSGCKTISFYPDNIVEIDNLHFHKGE